MFPGWLTAGRPGRSTVAMSGRPGRSTDVHRTCTQPSWEAGRPGRSTARELCSLESLRSTGSVDRAESSALCKPARSTGRSTGQRVVALWFWHGRPGGRPEGSTIDLFTISRSTGRPIWAFLAANGQIFKWVINTPFESYFSTSFQEQNFRSFQMF